MTTARKKRGQERAFIEAAVACGASDLRIISRHVLPNAMPVVPVVLALVFAQALLIEASLGFLGLRDPDTMSWGYLASEAQRFLRVGWWMAFFPGLAILAAVLGVNLLADAANSAGNRRHRPMCRYEAPAHEGNGLPQPSLRT